MRALSCLDARVSYARLAEVAASAGSDAVAVGDDVVGNPELCARLRESHLGLVLNLPLLFEPGVLASLPSSYAVSSTGGRAVADWLHMACPRSDEFWDRRLEAMGRALDELQPDTVSLDFARSFVLWERIGPEASAADIEHGCFCVACVGTPPTGDRDVLARRSTRAVTARVEQAAALVRTRSPHSLVGVKVVPWLSTDYDGAQQWACGQDLRALADVVDVMMPMSYSAMIGRPVSHLRALHDEIRRTTGLPLMPWLQAADPYATEPLALDSLSAMLAVVADDGDLGYSVFHLDGIADRPEVLSILAA